jgi:hypothetical protein
LHRRALRSCFHQSSTAVSRRSQSTAESNMRLKLARETVTSDSEARTSPASVAPASAARDRGRSTDSEWRPCGHNP